MYMVICIIQFKKPIKYRNEIEEYFKVTNTNTNTYSFSNYNNFQLSKHKSATNKINDNLQK